MKRKLRLFLFLMLMANFSITPYVYALDDVVGLLGSSEPVISMDLQDASIKDVLKILSIQSNLNFVASEGLQDRKLTLFMDKVPLKEAMSKIFKANNLSYELDNDATVFIVKDLGKPQVETITEIFKLKYATVSSSSIKEEMKNYISPQEDTAGSTSSGGSSTSSSSSSSSSTTESGKWKMEEESGITYSVKKLLSKDGSLIEDYRTNSLIITDTPNRMAVIRKVIASLDVAVSQVMLEVEMLDVSKNVVDAMGIKFSGSVLTAALGNPVTESLGFPFKSWGKVIVPQTGGTLTVGSTLAAQIDWLRTQTDTKFLARPKIRTLNNETAEINISTNESIGVTTSGQQSTGEVTATPERSYTGVVLRITPQIDDESGEVTMWIYPTVSEAVAGNTITVAGTTYKYRDPEIRSTKSVVKVKDGETIILGGLIRNQKTVVYTKLPILGEIPILGALFRHKDQTLNKDRELLIFITPRIIKDMDAIGKRAGFNQQARKLILPDREQTTVSAINRQSSINTHLNTFERKR